MMKFAIEARWLAATDTTGWEKQAYCHFTFHDVSVTSRLSKIFN